MTPAGLISTLRRRVERDRDDISKFRAEIKIRKRRIVLDEQVIAATRADVQALEERDR